MAWGSQDEAFEEQEREIVHESFIFPEDSNETVELTAGGGDNAFGVWAEIKDNLLVTFSSKATSDLHISGILIEEADTPEKIYVLELAYGDSKTNVARSRFGQGTRFISVVTQETKVRGVHVPTGETIYYQMKCETGGAKCKVHFRYHLH